MPRPAKKSSYKRDKLKTIFNYIKKYAPMPIFTYRQAGATSFTWPKVIGITKGRTLSVDERIKFSISWLMQQERGKDVAAIGFFKKIEPYLPDDLKCPISLMNSKNQAGRVSEETQEVINDFYDWFDTYKENVENELVKFYINLGDKNGAHFLKILERRFSSHWNEKRVLHLEGEIKENIKAEVDNNINGSVNFNFKVVSPEDTKEEETEGG